MIGTNITYTMLLRVSHRTPVILKYDFFPQRFSNPPQVAAHHYITALDIDRVLAKRLPASRGVTVWADVQVVLSVLQKPREVIIPNGSFHLADGGAHDC